MPSTQHFEELNGVTEEIALNFWASNLRDVMGGKRWAQIQSSTGAYLASVLGHFCFQSVDRRKILDPEYAVSENEFRQFADLTQVAEMMMEQLTTANNPLWMESAGAHILFYAGFFQNQNRRRHNIDFFTAMGRDCYRMAAVGKRERMMRLLAREFDGYLFFLSELQKHLEDKRYLINPQN